MGGAAAGEPEHSSPGRWLLAFALVIVLALVAIAWVTMGDVVGDGCGGQYYFDECHDAQSRWAALGRIGIWLSLVAAAVIAMVRRRSTLLYTAIVGYAIAIAATHLGVARAQDRPAPQPPPGSGYFEPGEAVVLGNEMLIARVWHQETGNWQQAIWRPPDLRTWQELPPIEVDRGSSGAKTVEVRAAVEGPSAIVLVGDGWGIGAIATFGPGRKAEVVFESEVSSINDVAHGPAGFLAVGEETGGPAMWRSLDGTTWARVEAVGGDGPLSGTYGLELVAASDHGYVVVDNIRTTNPEQALLWFTPDLVSWHKTDLAAAVHGLVVYGDQWLAAAGLGVWASTDGLDWELASTPPEAPPSPTLIVAGDRLVLTASDGGELSTSIDGRTWHRIIDPTGLPKPKSFGPVVFIGDRFYALLVVSDGDHWDMWQIWQSADGGHWTRVLPGG